MYIANADRYRDMIYRRCGQSGILLPAVSIGLWHNFGGVDALDNGRAMLRRAFDLGITHFDLANNTKAGYDMWPGPYGNFGSRKYLLASLDQSLRRLGLEYVDIFYSHRPDPDTPLEETMMALDQAVRSGKALYAGISNYDAERTAKAAEILRRLGTPCLIHQMKYSMFVRWSEGGLLAQLKADGIGGIAFSPLAQGLLTDRYLNGIPAGSRASKPSGFLKERDVDEAHLSKARALQDIARERGQSLAQMALAWVLRDGVIASVLIGASSVEQVEQNVAALGKLDFSPEELARIDAILG